MKFKSIIMSMLAVATLASCNKENEGIPDLPVGDATKAYMSISIQMPTSSATRATNGGPGTDNGTTEEQGVTSVTVVGYDNVGNKVGVYSLTPGTIGVAGTAATASEPIEVASTVKKIFVVVNPTAETTAKLQMEGGVSSFNVLLSTIIDSEAVGVLTKDDEFMMTSENGLQDVATLVKTPANSTPEAIEAAKVAAKAAPADVKVNRAVSKVTMTHVTLDNASVADGAAATITGFLLNTTNKSYHPYSELVTYVTTSDPLLAKYRKDPNMNALEMTDTGEGPAADAFNWVGNPDKVTTHDWKAKDASLYCLENTMNAAAQDYNNTTKMLIKATFTPAGVTATSKSWFRVNGIVMTFDNLQALYAADATAAATKTAFDAFAVKFKPTATSFADVTFAELEDVDNGGYVAATVTPYMIEYYQESICYYDVNIRHDYNVVAGGLGRWGVVRNNFYTLNVETISKAGKPYIPDPTDPDITDPENPDPENPTPDDAINAYLSVKITVNPWTTWMQGVDL